MRLRAVIFDDEAAIRQLLWHVCDRRGYEIFTFPHPALCSLHTMPQCPCAAGTTCADIILCDLNMPHVKGLEFVETLRAKRCSIPYIALMSGAWSAEEADRAARSGCRLFTKPFTMTELDAWLDTVEAMVAPERSLLQWETSKWG